LITVKKKLYLINFSKEIQQQQVATYQAGKYIDKINKKNLHKSMFLSKSVILDFNQ